MSSSDPSALFDISQLPSLKKGMSIKQEATQRRKTCRFIEEAGRILKLPRVAIATAMVMFHRFYAKHAFDDHDRFEVAVACIVLAAKTEESPKKISVVITECHKLKVRGIKAGRISSSGQSPPRKDDPPEILDPKGEEYTKLKERILLLERVILHTIGFELSIDHPYKFLMDQIKLIVNKQQVEFIDAKDVDNLSTNEAMRKMLNRLVQMAMNFANDSMQTTLCLQFDPKQIATACVYLGCNFAKVRPANGKTWLEVLDQPSVDTLASISLQVLELIAERKGTDRAIIDKIKSYLNQLQDVPNAKSAAADSAGQPDAKRQRT